MVSEETRVVDPATGGEKGAKLARFSLIPSGWLWALAEHYGRGAKKYADRNWERGYAWSLSLDAHSRHLNQWLLGEDNDPETDSSHLVAAAWHLIALWFFHAYGKGTDDIRVGQQERPSKAPVETQNAYYRFVPGAAGGTNDRVITFGTWTDVGHGAGCTCQQCDTL